MARILFVEDETEVLGTLTKYFERQGHTAHGAREGRAREVEEGPKEAGKEGEEAGERG